MESYRIILEKELVPKWKNDNVINIPLIDIMDKKLSGKIVAYTTINNKRIGLISNKNEFNFDLDKTIDFFRLERYCEKKRPLLSYLPFHYHKVPFRFLIGKILNKNAMKKIESIKFPNWPIEEGLEVLLEIKKRSKKKSVVLLSHDVDTGKGFTNIPMFFDIEKKLNLKSTWFVVGHYYKIDKGIINDLLKNKHEIGLHGYNHDGKLPFLSEKRIRKRLDKSVGRFKEYGIELSGFRAPALNTSDRLNRILKDYFIYSSSVPDTELYLPHTIRSGCCTVFPFRNELLQIPITVPMDTSLLFLGYEPNDIFDIWVKKVEWIRKLGGVINVVTHTEDHFAANKSMLKIYEKFLEYLIKEDLVFMTHKEFAKKFSIK